MLAGSCRLHRGIECQNVCLERNVVNDLDDLGNVGRGLIDIVHGLQHDLHVVDALYCVVFGHEGNFAGLGGPLGILLGLHRNLLQGRGELFH
ncbi:hypothetical protein SDC9_101375 [bioreactor metagenome]|uniref:Uncharacterized protein n=1 Tax=bioreactor metagenome TaxID=1076179 RepID=A0A645ANH5_9ZZZZ